MDSNARPPPPLPAHETKGESCLAYTFLQNQFNLIQLDNGTSNGTSLWLGSQCLSLYLADINSALQKKLKHSRKNGSEQNIRVKPTAIELGSGVGLGSLALSSLGWDVIATDTPYVVASVLAPNVAGNPIDESSFTGSVQVRELDWTVPSSQWTWTSSEYIARQGESNLDAPQAGNIEHPIFDLIISSDTIYDPRLAAHLIDTIRALALSYWRRRKRSPFIYLALENRDPDTVTGALQKARRDGFSVNRVPHDQVASSIARGGISWADDDWDDIEIWKLSLVSSELCT
ncbi:hypothetical protein FRC03_000034 [Tulasnella sp. 419]|nr:hypothetical protein FRC03_000034 [Tulasnella sp. 419]